MNRRSYRAIRPVLVPILVGALLVTGCSSGYVTIDRDDISADEPARSYRVMLTDGSAREFISLTAEDEALLGTERVTTQVAEGEGETARTSTWNRYEETSIPWSEVASIEADFGEKKDTGVFLIAAGVALGAALFLILGSSSDDPDTDDGGKEPF